MVEGISLPVATLASNKSSGKPERPVTVIIKNNTHKRAAIRHQMTSKALEKKQPRGERSFVAGVVLEGVGDFISYEFRNEVASYGESFIPLDTLPLSKKLCFSGEYQANSDGAIIERIDDYGTKRTYTCEWAGGDKENPLFNWVEM